MTHDAEIDKVETPGDSCHLPGVGGVGQPNSATYPTLALVAAFLLQWALLFSIRGPLWDATFYYAYARSIIFDGDLKIDNDLRLSYSTNTPAFAAKQLDQQRTATGRVPTPFATGSALLWLPWLGVLRLAAAAGQEVGLAPPQLTGYEWLFVAGVATFSALLGLLAFWLAHAVARAETGRFSALAATLTLLFATPLLYYQYREPLYSHATSAFVTALCVYAWWRWGQAPPAAGQALLIGTLIGLATLVRWQHVVYLGLPLASTAGWWLALPRPVRRAHWRRPLLYLALSGLAALAVLSIQFALWRLFFGAWLTLPQGNSFMDWRAPLWQPALFSTYRGLLPWMPVALPAILGLLLLAQRRPGLALPLLFVLALAVYVNGSARDWFGGGGFGPRRFTSELTLFVVGYAAFLEALAGSRRPLARRLGQAAGLLAGLALGLQQWILLRYGLLEKIGGYHLSMEPAFEWVDEPLAAFGQRLAAHGLDFLYSPVDFFIFPGSPLDRLINAQAWPGRHLAALVATTAFLLLLVGGGRWLWPRLGTTTAARRRLAFAAGLALVAANAWILFWA
ncbi:MAG: hypothetical protein L0346_03920 [Chloroflexi bacterium]|nr:hypothetical protein [Chloroflexota bacterium]